MSKFVRKILRETCGDCGVKEGQLHKLGCDMEHCPFCGHQLIWCDCPDSGTEEWKKRLEGKRFPFILYPTLCAKCGTLWPDLFKVPDAEWEHYVEPGMREQVLCKPCYLQIKAWTDGVDILEQSPQAQEQRLKYEAAMAEKRASRPAR